MKRPSQKNQEVIVLFNSLDQLSSRFPLCAKQEIFIPGIIEFLSGEGVTSIFIAVDEPGQPIEQYGLLPMADLILSFYPKVIGAKDYFNHIKTKQNWDYPEDDVFYESIMKPIEEFKQRMDSNENLKVNIIALQVVRFAGGKRAGEEGILELVDNDDNRGLYPGRGLHFTEFNPAYDTGELTYKKKF